LAGVLVKDFEADRFVESQDFAFGAEKTANYGFEILNANKKESSQGGGTQGWTLQIGANRPS
jgi:hypothetical protein